MAKIHCSEGIQIFDQETAPPSVLMSSQTGLVWQISKDGRTLAPETSQVVPKGAKLLNSYPIKAVLSMHFSICAEPGSTPILELQFSHVFEASPICAESIRKAASKSMFSLCSAFDQSLAGFAYEEGRARAPFDSGSLFLR